MWVAGTFSINFYIPMCFKGIIVSMFLIRLHLTHQDIILLELVLVQVSCTS